MEKKIAPPYTSPNLVQNLLSDWLWAIYTKIGEGLSEMGMSTLIG